MTDVRRALAAAAAFALLPLLAGCATIVNGAHQNVQITCDPPGATVTVLPQNTTLVTPGEVQLQRKHVHTLLLEADCHEPATLYLDHDASWFVVPNAIFFVGVGLAMLAVDADTGAVWNLIPDPAHAKLVPRPDADAAACGSVAGTR